MLDEKMEQLMTEFYELKKEITTGEVSIKRNNLLYRKYMLMLTLFNRYCAVKDQKRKKDEKRRKIESIIALTVIWVLSIVNPFVILLLNPFLKTKIKERKQSDEEKQKELSNCLIVDNIGKIIYNKLMKRIFDLTPEQTDAIDEEVVRTDARGILTPVIYEMLADTYGVDQISIGDVENQVKFKNQVRELKQRN